MLSFIFFDLALNPLNEIYQDFVLYIQNNDEKKPAELHT